MIRKVVSFFRRRLGRDFTRYGDSVIPSPDMRWCGPEFKDDAYYIQSAEAEARRLAALGCTADSTVLDIGCGQGRVAIGLHRVLGDVHYTGLDLHSGAIQWCQKHIQSRHLSFRFGHFDIYNSRYNPDGQPLDDSFHLTVGDSSQDFVYLYSVFSHMTQEDMVIYLREIRRVLRPNGVLFFTTFVEDDVPPFEENPPNYFYLPYNGPLHVCRYARGHLFDLLKQIGLNVVDFAHRTEADNQSAIYCRKV